MYRDLFSDFNLIENLIFINNNKVLTIEFNAFNNASGLSMDYLSFVNLKEFSSDYFCMKVLDLSSQKIEILFSNSIKGNFEKLYLDNNLIGTFQLKKNRLDCCPIWLKFRFRTI